MKNETNERVYNFFSELLKQVKIIFLFCKIK